MRIGVLAVTRGGMKLAEKIADALPDAQFLDRQGQKTAQLLAANWPSFDGFVCVMATGIVVRAIAPLLQDKLKDPAVVVCDEKARHAISLLSGHIGGGNRLTHEVAAIIGADPVITTASDTLGVTALDLWAEQHQLTPHSKKALTSQSTNLVNNGQLKIYSEVAVNSLPEEFIVTDRLNEADLIVGISCKYEGARPESLILHPISLVIGIGCNRNTPEQEIAAAQTELFAELNLASGAIRNIASIDKKSDEEGLVDFANHRGWRIDFFDSSRINSLTNLEISFAALKAVGAIGVAEPAALLSAGSNLLLCRKRKWKNVTMAVAQAPFSL